MAFLEIGQPLVPVGWTLLPAFFHCVVELLLSFARLGLRQRLIVAFDQVSIRLPVEKDDLLSLRFRRLRAAIGIQLTLLDALHERVVCLLLPVAHVVLHGSTHNLIGRKRHYGGTRPTDWGIIISLGKGYSGQGEKKNSNQKCGWPQLSVRQFPHSFVDRLESS